MIFFSGTIINKLYLWIGFVDPKISQTLFSVTFVSVYDVENNIESSIEFHIAKLYYAQ